MKNLFLIRHAMAVERMSRESDLQRTLTPKGFRDATRIGRKLFELDVQPDTIYSSHSERTRNTAELIAEQLKYDAQKIEFSEELYEASPRTLYSFIKAFPDDFKNILVVGHNPSVTYFAEYITHHDIGNILPAGMVHIQFDVDHWSLIDEGNSSFIRYEHPPLEEV